MDDSGLEAQIAAARAYESLFVPALFGEWAARLAAHAAIAAGQRVLDVGCGTGVFAREALRRTGATGYVAAVDPVAGMLTFAAELAPGIDWRLGTAESLPFADSSFDVVGSQFSLMFMDRGKSVREMLRVLKTGGRLVVAVWNSADNIPAYSAEIALVERLAGAIAGEALRAPFTLGDARLLSRLFEEAGATTVALRTIACTATFPSVRAMVEADLRGWLPVMDVHLDEDSIERILEEADVALRTFVLEDGRASFGTSAHLVTVEKP